MAESTPKRRVRNPDTFRERARKANESAKQPRKAGLIKRLLAPVFGPIGRGIAKTFRWKPLAILLKVLFPRYFRNSWRELRQVTWPNWKQSRQLTFAVLIFAIVFGASIAAVDYGLDKVFRNILLK